MRPTVIQESSSVTILEVRETSSLLVLYILVNSATYFPSALRYAVQQGSRAREAGGCELKTFRAKDRRPRNLCWSFIPNFTVILTCLEKVMIVKSRIGLGGREAIEARDESDLNFFPIAASTATHQELSLSNLISDLKSQAK